MVRALTVALLVLVVSCTAMVFYFWHTNPEIEHWKDLFRKGQSHLEAHPIILVVALMTLPGIGFPISPLLIFFGMVAGAQFGLPAACAIGIVATLVCSIWTYALSYGPLRHFLKKYLSNKARPLEFADSKTLLFAFIIRITPGIPYALQNIILGVAGIKFKYYLLATLPVQPLYVIGFIVTGGSFIQGRTGLAITGISLLLILILSTRIFYNHAKNHAE